jgi:hypothetical protein
VPERSNGAVPEIPTLFAPFRPLSATSGNGRPGGNRSLPECLFAPSPLPTCRREHAEAEQGDEGATPDREQGYPNPARHTGVDGAEKTIGRRTNTARTSPAPCRCAPTRGRSHACRADSRNDGSGDGGVSGCRTHGALRAALSAIALLSAGVQDPPTTTSTLTETAAGQWQGEQALPTATASGAPPTVPPSAGDTAGSSLPNPTGLTGAEAKTTAGNLAREVAVGLQGAEAKTTAGELTARVEPKVVPMSGRITSGSSVTVDATIIRAAKAPPVPDAGALPASAEQRPAAYQFGVRDGKIDVLPEPLEPENREFALDTYHELVAKARELHERLKGTNSARRVCDSIERLLTALGTQFDDLRPGVLLSRSRSIEADRTAFGEELFPDTIAMMDDTLQTLHDLLAAFPIVRRIENERLALDLDRNADAISAIQQEMDAVKVAAAQSGAVTEEAINALAHNDSAIEDAIDPVVRTSLIADNLLVLRNFASAVIGGIAGYGRLAIAKVGPELAGLGDDIWNEIRGRLPNAVGLAVTVAPLFLLADQISDPYLRIGATVPALTPVANVLRKAIADSLKAALAGKAKDKQRKGRGKNR